MVHIVVCRNAHAEKTDSLKLLVFSALLLLRDVSAFAFLPSLIGPRARPFHILPFRSSPSSSSSPFSSSSSSPSNRNNQQHHQNSHHYNKNDDDRRRAEFINLEPLLETDKRRQRIEQDLVTRAQFVEFGDDLWELRTKMDQLSSKLVRAIDEGEDEVEQHMRKKLRTIERKDPELVYMLELADMEEAKREHRLTDAIRHKEKAFAARSCLPQFNLEGLWVGKYGNHGYELINVTYVGDTLVATKVTGDKNVPKGECTFQVDLHPLHYGTKRNVVQLQPIMLTDKAAKKWGTRKLPRYVGMGQVAEEGFSNHQWIEGQLIIINDDYFSFAWTPIEQQIFFGRPSPELALRMLRDHAALSSSLSVAKEFVQPPTMDDDIEIQKKYAMRCLSKTIEYEDDRSLDGDAFGCIWHDADTEECYLE